MKQETIIKNILEKDGVISNKQAIEMGIWRLASLINRLRNKGMKINTAYNDFYHKRNTHYYLIKE